MYITWDFLIICIKQLSHEKIIFKYKIFHSTKKGFNNFFNNSVTEHTMSYEQHRYYKALV